MNCARDERVKVWGGGGVEDYPVDTRVLETFFTQELTVKLSTTARR